MRGRVTNGKVFMVLNGKLQKLSTAKYCLLRDFANKNFAMCERALRRLSGSI